jgi:hypothetical protein
LFSSHFNLFRKLILKFKGNLIHIYLFPKKRGVKHLNIHRGVAVMESHLTYEYIGLFLK